MDNRQPADPAAYQLGQATLAAALFDARRRNLQPPPKLTLSQWAAKYAMLSPETSAQTGRFQAYAYQIGMMDAVTDPTIDEITIMKSARVGYTKILDHVSGYFIHQDPSAILVVQPRVEDAEDYSATEVEPMLRDTPVLAEITGDLKAKNAKQKLLKRVFRNGASMSFVGANTNAQGQPDNSYLEIETMFLLVYVLRALRSLVTTKYGRVKLAADGTRLLPGSNVVTPSIIRADLIAKYRELEAAGMVQQSDAFASGLVVEKDAANPNRVNVLYPAVLIDQLRTFAALVQFRLS